VTKTVDFYFAVVSSYAYLAVPRLAELAQRTGASIKFKPVNIGKVFESSETTPPPKQSDVRKAYRAVDQARVAKAHDLPINLKPAFWPVPMELASGMVNRYPGRRWRPHGVDPSHPESHLGGGQKYRR
jgi:2-hydroxychromene-2-carboxylate isomerase